MHSSHTFHAHPHSCSTGCTHLYARQHRLLAHSHIYTHTPTFPYLQRHTGCTLTLCACTSATFCTIILALVSLHAHTSTLLIRLCSCTRINACTLPHADALPSLHTVCTHCMLTLALQDATRTPLCSPAPTACTHPRMPPALADGCTLHTLHSHLAHLQQPHLAPPPHFYRTACPLPALTPYTLAQTLTQPLHTPALPTHAPTHHASHPGHLHFCPPPRGSFACSQPCAPPHPLHNPSPCTPAPYLALWCVGRGGAARRYKGAGPPRHPAPPPQHPAPPGPTHWKFPTFHGDGGGGTETRNQGGCRVTPSLPRVTLLTPLCLPAVSRVLWRGGCSPWR